LPVDIFRLFRLRKNISGGEHFLKEEQRYHVSRSVTEKYKCEKTRMDRYCSSIVRLLRGRELGSQNALTGNPKRCTKHKKLQTCDNIISCDRLFYDGVYLSLDTCHSVILGSVNKKYRDSWTHTEAAKVLENTLYVFNIVKEYDDIYIEVRKYLDGELHMTIDAMKIIPKLSVPLEEWEKFKKIRNWGALIRETYSGIMWGVDGFIDSATYKLQTDRTTNGLWDVRVYGSKIKRSVWNNYYVSHSEEFEPLILPRAAFKELQKNELLRSTR